MDHLGQIETFITDVNAAQNIEEVFASLRAHIERLGFNRFTYELMWGGESKRRPLFITSFPADWIGRYIEKKYAGDDMVPRYSAQVIRPFVWSEVKQRGNLTKAQRLVFNEASEVGLRTGGTIPIHGPGSVRAYLGVATDAEDEVFIKLFAQVRHELQLIATYAHEKILSFGIENTVIESVKLTPREIEIMTWTARGKTRWEISEILSIADTTVKAHTENACRKLNASNKTHATAVALIYGLISP